MASSPGVDAALGDVADRVAELLIAGPRCMPIETQKDRCQVLHRAQRTVQDLTPFPDTVSPGVVACKESDYLRSGNPRYRNP